MAFYAVNVFSRQLVYGWESWDGGVGVGHAVHQNASGVSKTLGGLVSGTLSADTAGQHSMAGQDEGVLSVADLNKQRL